MVIFILFSEIFNIFLSNITSMNQYVYILFYKKIIINENFNMIFCIILPTQNKHVLRLIF